MLKVYIDFWDLSSKNSYYSNAAKRLAALSGFSPVEILRGETGKPRVLKPQGWYFNLSHSADLVCCGYSNVEIGLDLECHKKRDFISMADTWFHQDERRHIRAGTGIQDFYTIWTKKEAWLKMKGKSVWEIEDAPDMIAGTQDNHCFSLYWKNQSFSLSYCLDNLKNQTVEMILFPNSPELIPA